MRLFIVPQTCCIKTSWSACSAFQAPSRSTDAVSFGTGPLHATVVRNLPPAIGGILMSRCVFFLLRPIHGRPEPVCSCGSDSERGSSAAAGPCYWRDDPATGAPLPIPGASACSCTPPTLIFACGASSGWSAATTPPTAERWRRTAEPFS